MAKHVYNNNLSLSFDYAIGSYPCSDAVSFRMGFVVEQHLLYFDCAEHLSGVHISMVQFVSENIFYRGKKSKFLAIKTQNHLIGSRTLRMAEVN